MVAGAVTLLQLEFYYRPNNTLFNKNWQPEVHLCPFFKTFFQVSSKRKSNIFNCVIDTMSAVKEFGLLVLLKFCSLRRRLKVNCCWSNHLCIWNLSRGCDKLKPGTTRSVVCVCAGESSCMCVCVWVCGPAFLVLSLFAVDAYDKHNNKSTECWISSRMLMFRERRGRRERGMGEQQL